MEQRTSPVAQWLELHASTAGVTDSDPWLSPCVAWPKKKDKWNRESGSKLSYLWSIDI